MDRFFLEWPHVIPILVKHSYINLQEYETFDSTRNTEVTDSKPKLSLCLISITP
jgi:hypothetical protein